MLLNASSVIMLGIDLKFSKIPYIQAEIELGNGLPDIRLTSQCLDAVKKAGFEVNSKFCPIV